MSGLEGKSLSTDCWTVGSLTIIRGIHGLAKLVLLAAIALVNVFFLVSIPFLVPGLAGIRGEDGAYLLVMGKGWSRDLDHPFFPGYWLGFSVVWV